MRYLVTTKETYSPFLTDYFDAENTWNNDIGMTVYDLSLSKYTTDGKNWIEIELDHL